MPADYSRRVHRTALGQLLAIWAALPRAVRRYAQDLGAVAAEEGREIPGRLVTAGIGFTIALILVVAGWIVLCAAAASSLVQALDWRWDMALYVVTAVNVALALIAGLVAYRALKTPFFPYTSHEFERLRHGELTHAHGATPAPAVAPGPRERELLRSEAELEARITEVRHATPQLIARPSVIATVAGVGLLAGLATARSRTRARRAATANAQTPLSRQLLNLAFGQLSSLAVAAALREFQRRAGHHAPPY